MPEQPERVLKLVIPAQRANPAPPIGPALGQRGVNTKDFCASFNAQTKHLEPGTLLSVWVTIRNDRSYSIELRGTPTVHLIRQQTAGTLSTKSLTASAAETIARTKLPTLNTRSLQKATKIIAGCAKSMGVSVSLPES